jgi:hypothetical protein
MQVQSVQSCKDVLRLEYVTYKIENTECKELDIVLLNV